MQYNKFFCPSNRLMSLQPQQLLSLLKEIGWGGLMRASFLAQWKTEALQVLGGLQVLTGL